MKVKWPRCLRSIKEVGPDYFKVKIEYRADDSEVKSLVN